MPSTDAYGRRYVTPEEIEQQAAEFADRLETVPIIRPVWNPQTLSMELRPTTRLQIKP